MGATRNGGSAARRGHGEGACYFDPTEKCWVATVEAGRDGKGKRRRIKRKAATKAEALAKAKQARQRLDAGQPTSDDRRTTKQYLDWWAAELLPGTVKPSTEANYRAVIDLYLTPHLGSVPLAKLGPQHVQTMMRALEAKGLSPRTRQLARGVLRRALGQAERWGAVTRNAAAMVESPKGAATKLDDALTAAQARKVLDTAAGDRLEALAVLALALGLRRGELLGLRWTDIDLDAGALTIRRTVSRVSRVGIVESTPKTDAGARTVPLIGQCAPALRRHRALQAAERLAAGPAWRGSSDPADGPVFTTPAGTVLDPSNAYHWWQKLTERAGIGKRRFHASRHTAATLLLDQGVPLEVVSAVLGHASLAITADVYARPTMDAKRRGLAKLAEAIGE